MATRGREYGDTPPGTMSVQRRCPPEVCTGCRGCGGWSQHPIPDNHRVASLDLSTPEAVERAIGIIGEGAVQALLAERG